MPARPSMAALLLGARVQDALQALHATEASARSAVEGARARRQEAEARLACRPSPSSVEVSTVNPPTRKDV